MFFNGEFAPSEVENCAVYPKYKFTGFTTDREMHNFTRSMALSEPASYKWIKLL